MTLSPRTKAALVEAIAGEGHSGIGLLAIRLGLDGRAVGANRLDRAMSLLRAIEESAVLEDPGAALLDAANTVLESANAWQIEHDARVRALIAALELDGYTFRDGRLLPSTPAPVAVEQAVSELERQLDAGGYAVALRHYRQAVDNYIQGHHEAANGQVRSFLEDLFIGVCRAHRGKDLNDAGAALQHLYQTGWLDRGEFNHYRHFWDDIQDNGPHRGLSSRDESLFRLHYATATALYLLSKLS